MIATSQMMNTSTGRQIGVDPARLCSARFFGISWISGLSRQPNRRDFQPIRDGESNKSIQPHETGWIDLRWLASVGVGVGIGAGVESL
ncbi:hypothetical protein I7I48_09368 [Histoplasma ohiense]|nr:hypothetical protein I7I48_09368 [Histoplasma ohiense (nom. inval.)]